MGLVYHNGVIEMKIEIKESAGETFGIEMTSETDKEKSILKCFWEDGIKVNGVAFLNSDVELQLTFAGLLDKSLEEGQRYLESKGLFKEIKS